MNKSKFDLTHSIITSTELGYLSPFLIQDIIPGDDFKFSTSFGVKFDPFLLPVFEDYFVYLDYYFVPYRILDKNFTKVITEIENPYFCKKLSEVVNFNLNSEKSLTQAFGIPYSDTFPIETISVYPYYAYWLIVNYYYRDKILDPAYNSDFDYNMFDVVPNLDDLFVTNYTTDYFQGAYKDSSLASPTALDGNKDGITTVNEMKLATRMQNLKETLMLLSRRRGNKYTNYLREVFDVSPREDLLNIPYHIGSQTKRLHVTELQTTTDTEERPLAAAAGRVADYNQGQWQDFKANEHGILLGLYSIKPEQHYQAGIPRVFQKTNYADFYNPMFVNLGLQELKRNELDVNANEEEVFGYTYRFQELRESYNRVTSGMINEKFWHSALNLEKEYLSDKFRKISSDRVNRVFTYNLPVYESDKLVPYNKYEYLTPIIKDNAVIYKHEPSYSLAGIVDDSIWTISKPVDDLLKVPAVAKPENFNEKEDYFTLYEYSISQFKKGQYLLNDKKYIVFLPHYNTGYPFIYGMNFTPILEIEPNNEPVIHTERINLPIVLVKPILPRTFRDDIMTGRAISPLLNFPRTGKYTEPYSLLNSELFFTPDNKEIVSYSPIYSLYYGVYTGNGSLDMLEEYKNLPFVVYNAETKTYLEPQMRDISHIRIKFLNEISAVRPIPLQYNPSLI